jgi:hypothetical protein
MFLTDVFLIEQLTVLNEGNKGNGPMRVRGIFQRADEANNNGRIYPKTILEGQVKKLQDKICDRTLCGELDHPQNDSVRLSNASHLITKLYMQGPEVIGEAEILNTPAGMTAKALIEGGVKIGISSRGTGTISENATGAKVVNEDFNMVTFDLVADPSTRAAYPGMCESTESELISNTMDKFGKEKNFLTMLESRFNESAIDNISSAGAASQGKGKKYLKNITKGLTGGAAAFTAGATRAAMHKPDELGSGPDGDGKDSQGRTKGEVVGSAMRRTVRALSPTLAKSTEDRRLRGNKAADARAAEVKAHQEKKDQGVVAKGKAQGHLDAKKASKPSEEEQAAADKKSRNENPGTVQTGVRPPKEGKANTTDPTKAGYNWTPGGKKARAKAQKDRVASAEFGEIGESRLKRNSIRSICLNLSNILEAAKKI